MLSRIIRNEWRSLRADGIVWLLVVIFVVLIGYGLLNGASRARKQSQTERDVAPRWEQKLSDLRSQLIERRPSAEGFGVPIPDNPYSMGAQKVDVALPPATLAALAVGQSDLYVNNSQAYLWSSADELFAKNEPDNPVNLLAGHFDLAFVLVYLYPILILAISYNLFSVEKEDGTLAFLLAQPVSLKQVLLAKIFARATIVMPILIISVIIGLIATRAPIVTGRGLLLLFLWAMLAVIYGLFWLTLAALVNAFNRSSATNAVLLAGLWVLFIVIVPSMISTVSTAVFPVPPRADLIIVNREREPDVRREGSHVLAKFYDDHPELRPTANPAEITEFRRQLLTVFLANAKTSQPIVERYDQQLARQQSFVNWLRFLSPAVVTQEAVDDLTGTGFMRYRDFRDQVNRFIEANRTFYVPKIIRGEKLFVADYDVMPRFNYREEPLARVAGRVLVGIAGLVALLSACLVGVSRRLRSYSVAG